jgi:hypothetical protein
MLQIGGDHGGGSFKFWVIPLVCENPDKITICNLIFKAEESRHNVEVAMGLISQEISTLQQAVWR